MVLQARTRDQWTSGSMTVPVVGEPVGAHLLCISHWSGMSLLGVGSGITNITHDGSYNGPQGIPRGVVGIH